MGFRAHSSKGVDKNGAKCNMVRAYDSNLLRKKGPCRQMSLHVRQRIVNCNAEQQRHQGIPSALWI